MKMHFLAMLLIFSVAGNLACNRAAPIQHPEISTTIDEDGLNNSKMIWSETTNFISGHPHKFSPTMLRTGIDTSNGVIILSGRPLKILYPAYRGIENVLGMPSDILTKTNNGVPTTVMDSTNIVWAFLPEFHERFVLTMTDTNGAPVPKTHEGSTIGQPSSLKPNMPWFRTSRRNGYMPIVLFPKEVEMFELDPTKYFQIEKSGLYKLTVVQRLYIVNTNQFLETLILPPVTVDVKVEK